MRRLAIALDTETTDLLPPNAANILFQPYITELYMCTFDLDTYEIVDEINTLVNIPILVPTHITKITGITDEMLEDKPTIADLIPKIVAICDGVDTVLGHNLMFDYEIVRRNFVRSGFESAMPHFENKICTVELSYPLKKKRMKLSDLYHHATGKNHEGAHRAKVDVLATIECYKWLVKEGF